MRIFLASAALMLGISSAALADTVKLKNGDTLKGTIASIEGGTMTFAHDSLGTIKIPLANVESFESDNPVTITPRSQEPVTEKVTGDSTTITAGERKFNVADLRGVNLPAQEWTGSIVGSASLARGNTNTLQAGLSALAALRRQDMENNDRFTLGAAYNYTRTGTGSTSTTTADNWNVFGKYDRFFEGEWDKLYGYATVKFEKDRIASLDYRLSPGVGLGYQWWERADSNFRTEIGLTYVVERYDPPGQNDDNISLRLAYAYDRVLVENVKFFHNLEYLPAFRDPGDYILTTDAGIRATLVDNFFTEFKLTYKRDSTPAPGSLKNDVIWYVGVGWQF